MTRFASAAVLLLIVTSLVAGSCVGTPQIPVDQQQYIEGVIVEGGALSFILKDDSGKEMRFAAYHDALYDPPDFHALAGDRLAVTYGVVGETGTKNVALEVVLLQPDENRVEMNSPAIGVIREAGMTRHKIHLPDHNFTVVMLKGKSTTSFPEDWEPETGDKVRVEFSETAGRFMRKTFYEGLQLLEKGPVSIEDFHAGGVVVHQDRGSITVRVPDGRMEIFFKESATTIDPEDAEPAAGDSVRIGYYHKLMGDRTLRPTAAAVQMIP